MYENKGKHDKITGDLPGFFTKIHRLRDKNHQSSRLFAEKTHVARYSRRNEKVVDTIMLANYSDRQWKFLETGYGAMAPALALASLLVGQFLLGGRHSSLMVSH